MRAQRGVIIQNIPSLSLFVHFFFGGKNLSTWLELKAPFLLIEKNGNAKTEEGVEGFGGGTDRPVVRSGDFFVQNRL